MLKAAMLKTFVSVLFLLFGSLCIVGDAFAKSAYVAPFNTVLNAIGQSSVSCGACHQSAGGGGPLVNNSCVTAFSNNHTYATLATCLHPTTTPPLNCTGNQVSNPAGTACTACPSTQTPNAAHTACVAITPPAAMNSVQGYLGLTTSGAAKTDVYQVTCANGTTLATKSASLTVAVRDLAPVLAPLISIQVIKGTFASALSADNVDGDANYSAPSVKLSAGPGIYTMTVNKSAVQAACNDSDDDEGSSQQCYVAGAEAYVALFACRNAAGIKTGTSAVITQNQ